MLKLVSDTAYLSGEEICSMFSAYPQFVFTDGSGIQIVQDSEGVFAYDPEGVYVTDTVDNIHGYEGATYIFGAVTVYDVAGTVRRLGSARGRQVVRLRILHEILHHYNLDADALETWFVAENHPILAAIYHTVGRSSGETWIGSAIQEHYYQFLLGSVDIAETEETYRISSRTYQGLEI